MSKYVPLSFKKFKSIYPYVNLNSKQIYHCENSQVLNLTDHHLITEFNVFQIFKKILLYIFSRWHTLVIDSTFYNYFCVVIIIL